MKKFKILTIIGTRPELIKLSRVIAELEKYTQHILVHTGQNYDYELNEIFFDELEIRKPDYFLEAATGSNLAQDISNIISRIDPILETEKPDAVLFYGDTNSTLAVIPAKRRKIPIFHMEAGNRSFDQRVPEEINRKIVDHLSDINMTISEHARRYLISEGIKPETIMKVGSCMAEIYDHYKNKIENSNALEKLNLRPKNYFLVSVHREDNVDSPDSLTEILQTLEAIIEKYNKRIIVSTHPRTRKRLEHLFSTQNISLNEKIEFMKPFGFLDYSKLLKNAFCVLSDSGSITEDASILNFPAITIRRMHERPEGMDVGTLIMSGLKKEYVLNAIDVVTNQFENDSCTITIVPDYDTRSVSKKVVRIILSYIDYINSTVWKKV